MTIANEQARQSQESARAAKPRVDFNRRELNEAAEGRKVKTSYDIIKETKKFEKYSKYWSFMSGFAALISATGAIWTLIKKKR